MRIAASQGAPRRSPYHSPLAKATAGASDEDFATAIALLRGGLFALIPIVLAFHGAASTNDHTGQGGRDRNI